MRRPRGRGGCAWGHGGEGKGEVKEVRPLQVRHSGRAVRRCGWDTRWVARTRTGCTAAASHLHVPQVNVQPVLRLNWVAQPQKMLLRHPHPNS